MVAMDVGSRSLEIAFERQPGSDAQLSRWRSERYMEPEELGEVLPVHSRPEG